MGVSYRATLVLQTGTCRCTGLPAVGSSRSLPRLPKRAKNMVELEGLEVVVDRVVYQPDMATPEDQHCFAYFLSQQLGEDRHN